MITTKVNLQLTAIDAVKKATSKNYSCILLVNKYGEVAISDTRYRYAIIIGEHLNPLVNEESLAKAVSTFFFKEKYMPKNFLLNEWEWAYTTKLKAIKEMGLTEQDVEDAFVAFKWLQDHSK